MLTGLLTNGYSSGNSGDHLLVNLSKQILNESGINVGSMISVLPNSFPDLPAHFNRFNESKYGILYNLHLTRAKEIVENYDAAFAVGGGYLRFSNCSDAVKTKLIHLKQIEICASNGLPTGLLPQSIGPLRVHKTAVLKVLSKAEWIAARDDRTMSELGSLQNIYRIPDLAILDWAQHKIFHNPKGKKIGLILRNLKGFPEWNSVASALASMPNAEVIVQSNTGNNNNDVLFLRSLGIDAKIWFAQEALNSEEFGVIISSRLHGSLMSIAKGIPTIHIAYERKSFGAFADLGISNFCVLPNSRNLELINHLANNLLHSAFAENEFWQKLESKRSDILIKRAQLKDMITGISR